MIQQPMPSPASTRSSGPGGGGKSHALSCASSGRSSPCSASSCVTARTALFGVTLTSSRFGLSTLGLPRKSDAAAGPPPRSCRRTTRHAQQRPNLSAGRTCAFASIRAPKLAIAARRLRCRVPRAPCARDGVASARCQCRGSGRGLGSRARPPRRKPAHASDLRKYMASQEAEMAETEEEEDLLLEQHRAFVPGDDREAAEATPYWADAVALLEKHKRARAPRQQLAFGGPRARARALRRGARRPRALRQARQDGDGGRAAAAAGVVRHRA